LHRYAECSAYVGKWKFERYLPLRIGLKLRLPKEHIAPVDAGVILSCGIGIIDWKGKRSGF